MLLRLRFPNALIADDFGVENWRNWRRGSTAALGLLAGSPCGPYAPSGKGCFLSDPRARCLFGIGAVACAHQPETVDVELLYATTHDDGARALAKIDDVMNTANYRRIIPSSVVGVERVRAASL